MGIGWKQEFEVPPQWPLGSGPVEFKPEFKPDSSHWAQLVSQINLLSATVNQAVAGQAFTRPAPQVGEIGAAASEEIRKLNERLDKIEAGLPAAKQ